MLIFLTGFMCSGKTTDGKITADRLQIPFLDLDEELEKQTGQSTSSFIETNGITTFRQLESEILHNTTQLLQQSHPEMSRNMDKPQAIIATGGGSVLIKKNRNYLMNPEHSVVWINLPFPLLLQRIHTNSRPLLQGLSETVIYTLYSERLPFYQMTANQQITSMPVAEQIIAITHNRFSINT